MSLRSPSAIAIAVAVTLGASSLLASSAAHADETAPFHMTDVKVYKTELGFETHFGQFENAALIGVQGHVQVPLGKRWSLTGRLPIAYANDDIQGDGLSLGNVTLEATFLINARRRRRATNVTGFNVSVSLPTAADDFDGIIASGNYFRFHLPDPGLYRPDVTTVRLHGTWRTGGRSFFGQLEAGLHQQFGAGDLTLLRFGGGLGVRVGSSVVLIGELITRSDILDDSDGDNLDSSLDLGMRARAGNGNISLRVFIPLDGYWRDRDALGVALGYEVGL